MAALSILFDRSGPLPVLPDTPPPQLSDLDLDRVIAAVTAGEPEHGRTPLTRFFRLPLTDAAEVRYRQDVYRDLERPSTRTVVDRWVATMGEVRASAELADSVSNRAERDGWALHGASLYVTAVTELRAGLAAAAPDSAALRRLLAHVDDYTHSPGFDAVRTDADATAAALAGVEYCVQIKGLQVKVRRYRGEADYGAEITEVFGRFRIDDPARIGAEPPSRPGLRGVEATVLDLVAYEHPDVFAELTRFRTRHAQYIDPTLDRFDDEVRFYLAFLDHVSMCAGAGLPFTLPVVTDVDCGLDVRDTYDLALAGSLVALGEPVVRNDLTLDPDERILVITGPNHGGKTALARAFGQVHYLAALGLPVPGTQARVGSFDELLTHFERGLDPTHALSRLEDDLLAVRHILDRATKRSVVVLNETFTSTSLADAAALGGALVKRLIDIGSRCAYVTFVDDIAEIEGPVVSMVATVAQNDPTIHTYRIERRRPASLAYAAAMARRHGLDHDTLVRRITQ